MAVPATNMMSMNGETNGYAAWRLTAQMGSMMGGITAPVNPTALPPTSPNP